MLNSKLYNLRYDSVSEKVLLDKKTPLYRKIVKGDKDIHFKESVIRDAIAKFPLELVIDPCREAGLVSDEEDWYLWKTEHSVGAGRIDVLLLSSGGRIGIVEVKRSSNPGNRREVVSQIIEYALCLKELNLSSMPEIPVTEEREKVASDQEIVEHMRNADHLLIIVGDFLDNKMIKLSDELIAKNLTNRWSLARIELALYSANSSANEYLIAPYVRQTIDSQFRSVINVEIEIKDDESTQTRSLTPTLLTSNAWMSTVDTKRSVITKDAFFINLEAKNPADVVNCIKCLIEDIQDDDLFIEWKSSSFVVKYRPPSTPKQAVTLFVIYYTGRFHLYLPWPKSQVSKVPDMDQNLVENYINELVALLGDSYSSETSINAKLSEIKDKIPDIVQLVKGFASKSKSDCEDHST